MKIYGDKGRLEILRACEPHKGGIVKCTIPIYMKNTNAPVINLLAISKSNILNPNNVAISKNIKIANYIEVSIPEMLVDRDFSSPNNFASGKAGDNYAMMFVAGDMNKIIVMGKV